MPNTPRLNLPYPLAEDPPDGPTQIGALASQLDSLTASDAQGTFAARPAAGTRGRYYWATDEARLYRDNGSSWELVSVPAGYFLDFREAHGTEGGYSANFGSGVHNFQSASGTLLVVSYTPPVNAWWEINFNCAALQKLDSTYDLTTQNLLVTPAPPGFSTAVARGDVTQNAAVNAYESVTMKRTVPLTAGIPYQTYAQVSVTSGALMRYLRTADALYIEARATAR